MSSSKLVLSMGVSVTLLAALSACSETNAADDGGERTGEIAPIGYSALFLQDPAQAAMVAAFQDTAGEKEVLPPTSANGDAGQQDTDIRNLVTAGAKSLMVIPADPAAVVPALDYARGRGLPVVTLMLGPSGGKADVSLQVDNFDIGRQACEFLAEKAGDDGTVLAIQGDMRQATAQQRDLGFRNCMKEKHPDIQVIVKTGGQWDPATAAASASAVLNSEPGLAGIFMASDGYVQPVAEVIRQQGRAKSVDQDGHVWTVAVDGTPTALDAIRDGSLDADLAQPVYDFVEHGLAYLELVADGGTVEVGATDHGSEVVMTEDDYPADVFPAILVTAENVDDPSHWANAAK